MDYDRTLTDASGALHSGAAKALHRARKEGVIVVICSGQPLVALRRLLPGLDAYVAENGAVVSRDGHVWRHPWNVRAHVVERLRAFGLAPQPFEVILSLPREAEAAANRALHGLNARCVPNVDSINIQPLEIDKGTGLARIQRANGIAIEETVAIGDGDNDVPLFAQAGLPVAVANATMPARAAAKITLERPGGDGVADFIERNLLRE